MGADEYKAMGFLPEAMRNYLLKLGWGHGDDEIISTEQAIEWFDLPGIGRAPARLDMAKMTNLNGHYIRAAENKYLYKLTMPFLTEKLGRDITALEYDRILRGMDGLKERAKTMIELAEGALVYTPLPADYDEKAIAFCNDTSKQYISVLRTALVTSDFTHGALETIMRECAQKLDIKLGALAQPLRVALTHRTVSPSLFEVMEILGKDETLARIDSYLNTQH